MSERSEREFERAMSPSERSERTVREREFERAMSPSERAVPLYCPYCGEEDLRPVEDPHGGWRCAGCLRTFALKLVGIGVPKKAVSE